MMAEVWIVLVALYKIACWWAKRDAETQAKLKALKEEVKNAISTKDTRALHRLLSQL